MSQGAAYSVLIVGSSKVKRGGINGSSVGLDPEKTHFGVSQRLVDEN